MISALIDSVYDVGNDMLSVKSAIAEALFTPDATQEAKSTR